MAEICPALLAKTTVEYNKLLLNVVNLTRRIQIDLSDGIFANHETINIEDTFWPSQILADLHLMYENPESIVDKAIAKHPHMVIVHAEAHGNLLNILKRLHKSTIKAGIALLPESDVKMYKELIENSDHVMIFGGFLGSYGGKADLSNLKKVEQIRKIHPDIEIGWDGGANDENAAEIFKNGVDVINVGGYIQKSPDPKSAYAILRRIANEFEIQDKRDKT
ncbi:hypothetical protein DYH10_02210 [Candidatus Saccharibacteria bacterium CPR2]|nr:hypothetical protein [Candidatus Saccharibacteria bacterium CPR2]